MRTSRKEIRAVLEAIRAHVEPFGIEVETSRMSRHLQVVLRRGREKRQMSLSSTPRADVKCQINFARQKSNRLMRDLGVEC